MVIFRSFVVCLPEGKTVEFTLNGDAASNCEWWMETTTRFFEWWMMNALRKAVIVSDSPVTEGATGRPGGHGQPITYGLGGIILLFWGRVARNKHQQTMKCPLKWLEINTYLQRIPKWETIKKHFSLWFSHKTTTIHGLLGGSHASWGCPMSSGIPGFIFSGIGLIHFSGWTKLLLLDPWLVRHGFHVIPDHPPGASPYPHEMPLGNPRKKPSMMVRIREIIPIWPNYSGWWNITLW